MVIDWEFFSQNLEEMDDLDDTKREYIEREINQFREAHKVNFVSFVTLFFYFPIKPSAADIYLLSMREQQSFHVQFSSCALANQMIKSKILTFKM